MNEDLRQQLAVAYAQAKLIGEQSKKGYSLSGYDEEIENYLKSYQFAYARIQALYSDIEP